MSLIEAVVGISRARTRDEPPGDVEPEYRPLVPVTDPGPLLAAVEDIRAARRAVEETCIDFCQRPNAVRTRSAASSRAVRS